MYPQSELNQLAAHKHALRLRIAEQRLTFAAKVASATQPLAWLDRVRAFFARCAPLAPFVAVPLSLAVQRTFFPRLKLLGLALHWAPTAYAALRRRQSNSIAK
jgi:hypothetical protein